MLKLPYTQNFANDAATASARWDLGAGTVDSGSKAASQASLTVHYDASTQSYTISAPGLNETFGPSQLQVSTGGRTHFGKYSGSVEKALLIDTQSMYSTSYFKYVSRGFYYKYDKSQSSKNDVDYYIFTYGLQTPATTMPTVGSATYNVDIMGELQVTGLAPREFHGYGGLSANFQTGMINFSTSTTESSGTGSVSGLGNGQLNTTSQISSSGSTFAGTFSYIDASSNISGPLNGRFYGPNAEEIGASFAAYQGDAALEGALIGRSIGEAAVVNKSLADLVVQQNFDAPTAQLVSTSSDGVHFNGVSAPNVAHDSNAAFVGIAVPSPANYISILPPQALNLPYDAFGSADKVSGARGANFQSYLESRNYTGMRLDLYKVGAGNSELALSYLDFGLWEIGNAGIGRVDQIFFTYGVRTQNNAIPHSGSAHYFGVAYGGATDTTLGARYDVSGTSQFNVNFDSHGLSGSMALNGKKIGDGSSRSFGQFDFLGAISSNGATAAALSQGGGSNVGQVQTQFYGPRAEEIGGPFSLTYSPGGANVAIAGVVAAKAN